MDVIRISTPLAEAELHLAGAHLATWTPRGERPVLYLSPRAVFAPGKPIRGGVPIIFPWFGPSEAGAHGYARTARWSLEEQRTLPDGRVEITMALPPHLRFRVTVGATLEMELEVVNSGKELLRFEEALHTYFAVGDVRQVSISGLEGSEYIDKVDASKRKPDKDAIHFTGERDQVHVNTRTTCVIHDPVWNRRIAIEKSGSLSTVVWNPWIERTPAFPDMDPGGWRDMVCVESGNIGENTVELAPGAAHRMSVTIRVYSPVA